MPLDAADTDVSLFRRWPSSVHPVCQHRTTTKRCSNFKPRAPRITLIRQLPRSLQLLQTEKGRSTPCGTSRPRRNKIRPLHGLDPKNLVSRCEAVAVLSETCDTSPYSTHVCDVNDTICILSCACRRGTFRSEDLLLCARASLRFREVASRCGRGTFVVWCIWRACRMNSCDCSRVGCICKDGTRFRTWLWTCSVAGLKILLIFGSNTVFCSRSW